MTKAEEQNRAAEVKKSCPCGLYLCAVMTNGEAFEFVRLGPGCTDHIRRMERLGWRRANRCDECGTIYA